MHDNVFSLLTRVQSGVLPAMATPVTPDGYSVDLHAVTTLAGFLIDSGVSGLFVGGTTGEGLLLDLDQRCALHEAAANAVAGRVPLLMHVGTNNTRDTLALAEHAAALKPDGIVCVTPTFYGMPDDALLAYFRQIASLAPDIPFFAYDIPQMAMNGVSPALLVRMLETIPNCAGVKCSRPDAQIIRQLIDVAGNDAMVFAGNERIALASLALGATGLISGLATAIPEPFVALTSAYGHGDLEAAQLEQRRINRLLDCLPAAERIGAIKLILQQRGIAAGPTVPPRPMPVDSDLWSRLSALL
ncbi:MAG TPA: dihydrodipicolinate synthase family protein [Candidatus Binatia bacterium]|nr:dihydrodipicolinate synthase family protein [Candidatus Binatia bacterium]